jgi:predicted Zn-dependent peptidase
MKRIYIILLLLAPAAVMAQVKIDRTKAPKPAPAPKIEIADPATFTLPNGLRVFVVQNTKLPRVSATLTIDRDPLIEGEKAGLTSLAGSLLTRGTKAKSKAALDEAVDFLGADLSGSSTSVSVSSLKKNFPQVMQLMAEVAFQPSLSSEELEKVRKQMLTGLQSAKDNPSAISSNVVNRLVYGKDHPYGDIETEATVKSVTLADIKNYFNTYWKPNIAYLVFVGDITAAEAKTLATKYFASWKRGDVAKKQFAAPTAPAKTYIAVVDRPSSVQSIISLAAPIELKPGTANAIPTSVMNEILGSSSGRLFANLREKHGFTYGAYSSTKPDKLTGEFNASASVRTEKTDSALAEFLYEFNRLRSEPISAEEVARMKNYLSGSFARSLEQPSTIANFALNIARYNLPKDYYRNYLTNLANVTGDDVRKMANTYVQPGNMHIVIVGNAKAITGLEKYGEVKYFDIYGNEIAKPTEKKVDPSVSVASIIQKAIDAVGGEKKISEVKDLLMTGIVSIMGTEINYTQKIVFPSAYSSELEVQGMVVQKDMISNGKYTRIAQGAEQPVDDKVKEELNERAAFSTELYMLKNNYKFNLKGIEAVDGKDAYVVAVTSPLGRTFTNYYDTKTGYKLKTSAERETPMGQLTIQTYFKKYDEWKDVKIPTKIFVDLGRFTQEINIAEVKVNSGLKAEDIK